MLSMVPAPPAGVLHSQLGGVTAALDILVALGTHRAMTEEEICVRLEITMEERRTRYARVRLG